jgi:hypothetical protein
LSLLLAVIGPWQQHRSAAQERFDFSLDVLHMPANRPTSPRRHLQSVSGKRAAGKRLDQKLDRIRSGNYQKGDFIIADAKDADMARGIHAPGPQRGPDGVMTGKPRSRTEWLDAIRELIRQDVLDIMLTSASTGEILAGEGLFKSGGMTLSIRANDATDIWVARGAKYRDNPSRPFATANLDRCREFCDLGLYSTTFNNDLDWDLAGLEAYADFRDHASTIGFRHFFEVFNPNVDTGLAAKDVPDFVNDMILKALGGVVREEHPLFLKMPYNGPAALEELARYDEARIIVGILGGSAGTTRDTFELIHQGEKYGARVALFGRKINVAEDPIQIVTLMRMVADGEINPVEAVKAYHAHLQRNGLKADRELAADLEVTEAVLKTGLAQSSSYA